MEGLHQTLSQLPQCLLVSIFHRVSYIFYSELLTHTAPSASPTSVSVSEVTSSSITVQWGTVPCIHRNGDITSYSVRYGEVGIGVGDRTIMTVSGDSSGGMYTITGLSSDTVYTVEVAAKTSAGTGVYSHQVSSNSKYYYKPILKLLWKCLQHNNNFT